MTAIDWLIEQLIPEDQHEGIMDIIEEAKEMEEQQTEISDEKIEKAARDYDNAVIYGPPLLHFEQGAFWYREKLKSGASQEK
jgi:hypothetical protein